MAQDHSNDPFMQALASVKQGERAVAAELRRMANGAPPYRRFTYMSSWIKNVWRAAADLLDPPSE